jgi:hypothetical protein
MDLHHTAVQCHVLTELEPGECIAESHVKREAIQQARQMLEVLLDLRTALLEKPKQPLL